jgi:hypothetical protein
VVCGEYHAGLSPGRLKVTRSGVETRNVTRQIASPDLAALLRRAVRRLPRGEALPDSLWAVRHRAILCLL